MRVITCLVYDHNLWIVALAAIMCFASSFVTAKLIGRTFGDRGDARFHWCFLSAVAAGAGIWSTHFIAMLGYEPGVPVTFDATLTILSAVIAVAGTGIGIGIGLLRNRLVAAMGGGTMIGLSIAAMHFVGMFGYRADGVVSWNVPYIVAAIVLAALFSSLAIDRLRRGAERRDLLIASLLLSIGIVCLHFTGMGAFSVTPIAGMQTITDTGAFSAMAVSIALVSLLIVGTGLSTHLVELRTRLLSQDQLEHIALHDALTGLANRHHFNETLRKECEAAREGGNFALLLIDLDRFKPVNDMLGHPVGDVVLRHAAERLRRAVSGDDLVARIGGDEFAIIAFGVDAEDVALGIAGRVVEVLARPFVINSQVAEIGASVGIALAPRDGVEAELLTQNADLALYSAKHGGRGRHRLFEPMLAETIQDQRSLEAELRRACLREDFSIVYQPVVETGTGRFVGAEALVRWNCKGRGAISPDRFIPVAEELGLVPRIGALVLRKACEQAVQWPDHMIIAVNVSPVQLVDLRFPRLVREVLEETGLPAHRLELEITETALIGNDELALRSLTKLREIGVMISLDDFGTGYSSLSYLHRYPIDRIKIDRSFIQQLPHDENSKSIVRAIAQLGAGLGMKITAEGIETAEQLDCVSGQRCDHVQGYFVSKPIDAAAIAEHFRTDPKRAAA